MRVTTLYAGGAGGADTAAGAIEAIEPLALAAGLPPETAAVAVADSSMTVGTWPLGPSISILAGPSGVSSMVTDAPSLGSVTFMPTCVESWGSSVSSNVTVVFADGTLTEITR